jgi:hypothetical protein
VVGIAVDVDIGVGVDTSKGVEQAESSITIIENQPGLVSEDMKTPDTILMATRQ